LLPFLITTIETMEIWGELVWQICTKIIYIFAQFSINPQWHSQSQSIREAIQRLTGPPTLSK
jgi:hypothetical protein